MWSAPNARNKIKFADVVVSTNPVIFLANRFSRLISLPTSTIFVPGASGITAILKYRSVNPISSSDVPLSYFTRPCHSFNLSLICYVLLKLAETYKISQKPNRHGKVLRRFDLHGSSLRCLCII